MAMDPWGHLAPWIFKDTIEKDNGRVGGSKFATSLLIASLVDIRPTIAITKAHMKVGDT